MHQNPRRALRRGRNAILWENAVIGTAEIRYFVRAFASGSSILPTSTLLDAEQCFERMEAGRR